MSFTNLEAGQVVAKGGDETNPGGVIPRLLIEIDVRSNPVLPMTQNVGGIPVPPDIIHSTLNQGGSGEKNGATDGGGHRDAPCYRSLPE